MFLSRAVPLTLAVAAVACSSGVDLLRLDTTVRPQTHPDSIRFLVEEPEQPYTVIALIAAHDVGSGFLGLFRKPARTSLQEAAARLGGDAVLVGTGSLSRVGTGGEYGGTVLQLSGKVIVFDREAARAN